MSKSFIALLMLAVPFSHSYAEDWNSALTDDLTPFSDENGNLISLRLFSEQSVVVAFFYTRCRKTCPLITIKKLEEIQKQLSARARSAEFLVITLDPDYDTSQVLLRFKKAHHLDFKNWHFLRADRASTRTLANKLGFRGIWDMSEHTSADDHVLHSFRICYFDSILQRVRFLDWDHRDVMSLIE